VKNSQKNLILWAFVIFAVLFHVLFCEWNLFWKNGDDTGAIIAEIWDGDSRDSRVTLYAHGESTLLAISLGVVIPLLLLIARIYLQLGWFNTIFVGSWLKKEINAWRSLSEQNPT